jgi:hypothetical protein
MDAAKEVLIAPDESVSVRTVTTEDHTMRLDNTAVIDAEIVDTTAAVLTLQTELTQVNAAIKTVKALKVKHTENEEAEKTAAHIALEAVDKMVGELTQVESGLEHSYAQFASLLVEVSNKEYYRFLEFPSMAKYIESISAKYGKCRAQLFGYVSTAKALLPYVSSDDLNTIGISKAKELTKAMKVTQKPIADDVLKAAVDPKVTVKDLLKILGDKVRIPAVEKGTWCDKYSQGFYATKEETDLLDQAWDRAMKQANLGPDTPDHIKRKMFLYILAQEYLNVPEASQE